MAFSARAIQDALGRLAGERQGFERLDSLPEVGGRTGTISAGRPSASASAGGNIAFAELDATLREYYPERTLISSDGFFSFSYRPIKSITLVGGDKATFEEPPA